MQEIPQFLQEMLLQQYGENITKKILVEINHEKKPVTFIVTGFLIAQPFTPPTTMPFTKYF